MTEARFDLSAQVISKLHSVLAQHANVERAVIYGSRAKGNYRQGSDIDICLFAPQGLDLSYLEMTNILDEIDDLLLPYAVDLSVFTHIENPDLRAHIERMGQVLYGRGMLPTMPKSPPCHASSNPSTKSRA